MKTDRAIAFIEAITIISSAVKHKSIAIAASQSQTLTIASPACL
ncbi:hypothetical protein [uncultured Nostoc sp.]